MNQDNDKDKESGLRNSVQKSNIGNIIFKLEKKSFKRYKINDDQL